MKILFTVATYNPLRDGVQNITEYYAEKLVAYGHEVTVITSSVKDRDETEFYNGVRIERVNVYTKASVYKGEIKQYKKRVIALSENIDVMVNVCLQTALSDCLLSILDDIRCKKVLYLHGMANFNLPAVPPYSASDYLKYLLHNFRWRLFYLSAFKKLRKYNKVIHLHHKDQTYIQCLKHGITHNIFLENGSNIEWRENQTDRVEQGSYLLCVSNYKADKNQEYVLRAYFESSSNRGLVFIGSDETVYLERLRKIYNELSKDRFQYKKVKFLVNISREETEEYIRNAYLFLTGSKGEKYPVMISEPMAVAVPFISTDVGIVRFLPGGIVVKNTGEMAEWIDILDKDIELRNSIGASGALYARNRQNMNSNAAELEKALIELTGEENYK